MKRIKTALILMFLAGAVHAEDTPDSVVQRFIDHAIAGRTNEAASCYAISNENQRRLVEARLQKYLSAAIAGDEKCQLLRSFVDGACAVTAILVTRTSAPDNIQIERCYMIREEDGWKMLPLSDAYHSRSNGLSPEQIAVFEKLDPLVNAYRQEERARLTKRKSDRDRDAPCEAPLPHH